MSTEIYHQVLELAKCLPCQDQLRLIAELTTGLIAEGDSVESSKSRPNSVRGIWKNLGLRSPSPENFEEARRDMVGHVAREEVVG